MSMNPEHEQHWLTVFLALEGIEDELETVDSEGGSTEVALEHIQQAIESLNALQSMLNQNQKEEVTE